MKTKFRTLKSVRRLVYDLRLLHRMRPLRGSMYIWEYLLRSRKLESILHGLMLDLGDWSRSHRRLHGRPAVIDDFLIAHSRDIRFALDELGTLLDELETVKMTAEQWAALDDYRLSLHAAWALDVCEPEAHQIARLAPKPPVARQVWQEPQKVTPVTDDDLIDAARVLGDVVRNKRAAEVALLIGPAIARIVWN